LIKFGGAGVMELTMDLTVEAISVELVACASLLTKVAQRCSTGPFPELID
jgi:hypothetical protein